MSELKTLKDFGKSRVGGGDFDNVYFLVSELKAEAVKWVKKYGIYNLDEFLNITGEDLKDE